MSGYIRKWHRENAKWENADSNLLQIARFMILGSIGFSLA